MVVVLYASHLPTYLRIGRVVSMYCVDDNDLDVGWGGGCGGAYPHTHTHDITSFADGFAIDSNFSRQQFNSIS